MPTSRTIKQCPLCKWQGVNRYVHMKNKHGLTMTDIKPGSILSLEKGEK